MRFSLLIFILAFIATSGTAQQDTTKKYQGIFYADIHTAFYHDFNKNTTPGTAFQLSTGILGYKRQLSEKLSGLIIYDVTRTTNFAFPDTIGINNYFEGSKYTAFLKAAEITYKPIKSFSISMGELLSDQYLTTQDRHWAHRYIAFTMQEMYRFGNPADFGVRATYTVFKGFNISAIVVNGEGPFRLQDNNSDFLYATNIEYKPNDKYILKLYGDYHRDPSGKGNNRSTQSFFAGLKQDKWLAGIEFSNVMNNSFVNNQSLQGVSVYGIYSLKDKINLIGRADILSKYANIENGLFWIAGIEYKPAQNVGFTLNFRRNSWNNQSMIYLSSGIRF